MWIRFTQLPFFFQLFGVASLAMILPSAHALTVENFAQARSFFYTGTLGLFLLSMIALAASNRKLEETGVQQLASLALGFFVLPLYLAIPEYDAIRTTYFINAYIDMVSAFTTTGFVVFDPDRLSDTLHLWRALVAWLGGALIWLAAVAILAPLNLGGFEVASSNRIHQTHFLTTAERRMFLQRNFSSLFPLYLGLTFVLWIALALSGIPGFESLIFAMSVLSTSGISAAKTMSDFGSNWVAEFIIILFLFLAISRGFIARERSSAGITSFPTKMEFRIARVVILGSVVLISARQIMQILSDQNTLFGIETLRMIWGNLFTVTSFLTTHGWTSSFWTPAQIWSGYSVPGILFLGLVLVGGGVATTSGGIKLLRVYALYANAVQEMDRLVHPSSIGQTRSVSQAELRSKAYIAWIFFMLFFISLAGVTLILSATGLTFESAFVGAISALSTTGPLNEMVFGEPFDFSSLSWSAKLTLAFAMVLGKLEVLVLLALFTSETWRG